jgi:hypothetical protein
LKVEGAAVDLEAVIDADLAGGLGTDLGAEGTADAEDAGRVDAADGLADVPGRLEELLAGIEGEGGAAGPDALVLGGEEGVVGKDRGVSWGRRAGAATLDPLTGRTFFPGKDRSLSGISERENRYE